MIFFERTVRERSNYSFDLHRISAEGDSTLENDELPKAQPYEPEVHFSS